MAALATAGAFLASPSLAQAPTDAQQALQKARTAYDALRFGKARDLAQKASETDPKNPDIYLLLGKAHYQLGELDEAMAAWKRTLALAPKESFAQKMLDVLQSRRKDVDARVRYIESLLADRLDAVAAVECGSLLDGGKTLSDAQRAAILILQAEVFGQLKAVAVEHLQTERQSGRLLHADPAALPPELAAAVAAAAAVRQEDPASRAEIHRRLALFESASGAFAVLILP